VGRLTASVPFLVVVKTSRRESQMHDQAATPVVKLACTGCELVYEPDPVAFVTGSTGCPRCGGWTWFAQLGPAESSAVPGVNRLAPQRRAFENEYPDPAAVLGRSTAGSGSPTTSR
jgi:hypothetical protein